jgi:O-antigen/teichoic acid export membrane protein
MLRSIGVAYNEVVVALLDEPLSSHNLRRFTGLLTGFSTLLILVIALTPLSTLWFQVFSGLESELADMAVIGLLIAIPTAGLSVLQSWYQGLILHGGRTRGITEAVILFLVICTALLGAGVMRGGVTGLYWVLAAFTIAMLIQTIWLWYRSRRNERQVQERDKGIIPLTPAESPTD